jgi:hypothetical protein
MACLKLAPKLEALGLLNCWFVSDDGFSHVSSLRQLARLYISGWISITEEGLDVLVELPGLRELVLEVHDPDYSPYATKDGLRRLCQLRSLEKLHLGGWKEVIDADVEEARLMIPHCTVTVGPGYC